MALRKLGDRTYLYPGSPSTLVVALDGGAVLVDPGHGKSRHKDIRRELQKLGLEPRAQLATHGHADHISVSARLDAPLYIHRSEFSMAESSLAREIATFGSAAPKGFLPFDLPGGVRVHGIFEWGDEPFGLKAVQLNGHSPGMTGFADGEESVIYVGDALFGERLVNSVGIPYFVELQLFRDSLGKVRGFAESGYVVIPSHGRPVVGEEALDLVDFNMARTHEVEELAIEALEKPMSADELTLDIMRHYGVEVTPERLALNFVPVRALLANLYNRGRIKAVVEKGLKWAVLRG